MFDSSISTAFPTSLLFNSDDSHLNSLLPCTPIYFHLLQLTSCRFLRQLIYNHRRTIPELAESATEIITFIPLDNRQSRMKTRRNF